MAHFSQANGHQMTASASQGIDGNRKEVTWAVGPALFYPPGTWALQVEKQMTPGLAAEWG